MYNVHYQSTTMKKTRLIVTIVFWDMKHTLSAAQRAPLALKTLSETIQWNGVQLVLQELKLSELQILNVLPLSLLVYLVHSKTVMCVKNVHFRLIQIWKML